MKAIFLTICSAIILNNVFGQRNGAVFIDNTDFPKGLEISSDSARHIYLTNGECLGHVTFSNSKKAVTYHVFYYGPTDSLIFKGILVERLKMENCQWKGGQDPHKSIPIHFVKGTYYFVSEFCPCGSASKGSCGNLAAKLNKWTKRE